MVLLPCMMIEKRNTLCVAYSSSCMRGRKKSREALEMGQKINAGLFGRENAGLFGRENGCDTWINSSDVKVFCGLHTRHRKRRTTEEGSILYALVHESSLVMRGRKSTEGRKGTEQYEFSVSIFHTHFPWNLVEVVQAKDTNITMPFFQDQALAHISHLIAAWTTILLLVWCAVETNTTHTLQKEGPQRKRKEKGKERHRRRTL